MNYISHAFKKLLFFKKKLLPAYDLNERKNKESVFGNENKTRTSLSSVATVNGITCSILSSLHVPSIPLEA